MIFRNTLSNLCKKKLQCFGQIFSEFQHCDLHSFRNRFMALLWLCFTCFKHVYTTKASKHWSITEKYIQDRNIILNLGKHYLNLWTKFWYSPIHFQISANYFYSVSAKYFQSFNIVTHAVSEMSLWHSYGFVFTCCKHLYIMKLQNNEINICI